MARTLIRGGTIVSMDPRIGDLERGDLLVEGERIAAIAPRLDADDARSVDAAGMIVMPGMVNAHMHTWQTGMRGLAADWTLLEYFRNMHAGLAPSFRPEDLYLANLVGALNQINCGTTTLVDWCHNNPTPTHTDRAVDGLEESGIRAAFLHGSPKPDPKATPRPFWETPHPRSEVERLRKNRFSGDDGLLTLGLAILGPHYATYDVAVHDFKLAREFGLIASMHCAGAAARTPDGWDRLAAAGLLGDGNNIVHGNDLSDAQLERMVGLGVSFTLTPETEMAHGHGFPITGRLRKLGAAPSLGVDLESSASGDMFTVARLALVTQRAFDNDAARRATGGPPETATITAREALSWVTNAGARMLKMEHRIGSLAPGKQADIVLVRTEDLNMCPVHDPVATLITQTSLANIDSVMIAGEFKKRDGKLLCADLAAKKRALAASGHRIVAETRGLRVMSS